MIKFQLFHAVSDKRLGLFLQEQDNWSPKLGMWHGADV